jgi:uncharacterized protein YjdB
MEKYKILNFFVMAVALLIMSGCGKDDENVTEAVTWVELDRHILALVIPDQATLTASVNDVTWSSSDDAIASVDNKGKVTAVAEGTATITVTAKDGKTATCTIMVTSELVPVTGVTLPSTLDLKVNEKEILQPAISPNNATFKVLTWLSSNSAIVSVNQNGELTAVALGAATITGTTIDGSNIKVTCEVNVVPTRVTSITFDSPTLTLKVTNKTTLKATVSPSDANVKTLTWASSDEAVAKVNQNGEVTAITEGAADITATSTDGSNITATCKLTVVAFELVTNGDFKTDDLKTSFFFTNNANPEIVNDSEKGRVMKIVSGTRLPNDWDLQFWVLLNPPAKKDEQYVFTMDVRSEKNCSFPTQAHYVPQTYTHWDIVGSISGKLEWNTYTKTVTISADHVGGADKGSMGSIAFNLGQIETTVYIANVSLIRIK